MNSKGYFRYCQELTDNLVVNFPNKNDLIEFVSEMVSSDYQYWIRLKYNNASTVDAVMEFEERMASEPALVKLHVSAYLNEHLVTNSGLAGVKKLFRMKSTSNVLSFGVYTSTGLYEFVLKKLGRNHSDMIEEVFSPSLYFTIVGETELRKEIL